MLQFMGLQRVGYDLATEQQQQFVHTEFLKETFRYPIKLSSKFGIWRKE